MNEIDLRKDLLCAKDEIVSKLDEVAKKISLLNDAVDNVGIRRYWIIAKAGNTYSLGNLLNPQSLYVDNVDGSSDIILQFDNEPVSYKIHTGEGRFIPCIGAKALVVNNDCSILAINKLIY
jgi:hypothetical protein